MLLERERSLLMIVDIQEKLVPATSEPEKTVENSRKLMEAATKLDVPVVVTEQYPRGLGATVSPLREIAPDGAIMDKVHFSCAADDRIRHRIRTSGRKQLVLAGMEAHVCIAQSAISFAADGYEVAVVADAITSRDPANKDLAIARMRQAGVGIVPAESVLFEWMHSAQDPAFREISKLIR